MSDVMTAKTPDDAVQDIQAQCSRIIILELCSHFLLLKEETALPTYRFRIQIDELNIKLYSYNYIIDLVVFTIRSLKHDYLLWYITIAVYINLNWRLTVIFTECALL